MSATEPAAQQPQAPSETPAAEPAQALTSASPEATADGTAALTDADATLAKPALPELSPAACAALLAERFPALFGAGRALPIKLRIQTDIQQRAPGVFSKKSLSIFLHRYTTSTAYLRALVNTPQRFDLDGVAAGDVAEEHRVAATAEVERRRGIVDARRQAERDALRQARRPGRNAAAAPGVPGAPGASASESEGAAPSERPPQADENRRPPRPRREGPAQPGDRPARPARPPHEGAGPRPADERGPRPPRPPRPMQPPHAHGTPTAVHGAAPDPEATAADGTTAAAPARPAAPQLSPAELEARRDRANLLRSYEASTITRANFCVLKRISEADLESQLVVARRERELRPPAPRHDERPDSRHGGRPDPRPEQRTDRGPRRDDSGRRADHRGPSRGAGPTDSKPPGKPSR